MQENMIPAIKQIRIDEMLKKMPFLNDAGGDDDALLPVNGEFKSGFGLRENPASGKEEMHYGLDLLAERGALVKAVLPGKVDKIEEAGGEETRIILQHDDGWTTVYGGVAEVRVKAGEEVQAAQVLGMLDSARLWKRPHLHLSCNWTDVHRTLLLLRHFAPSEDDPET